MARELRVCEQRAILALQMWSGCGEAESEAEGTEEEANLAKSRAWKPDHILRVCAVGGRISVLHRAVLPKMLQQPWPPSFLSPTSAEPPGLVEWRPESLPAWSPLDWVLGLRPETTRREFGKRALLEPLG
jgi:hypothetical protein